MSQMNIFQQQDFSGGLNLRSDQFQLGDNESPKMLNVEIDPRGGVFSRGGMTRINPTAVTDPWIPEKLTAFAGDGSSPTVMLSNGPNIYRFNAGAFTKLLYGAGTPVSSTSTHGVCTAVWGSRLYMAAGAANTLNSFYWDIGSTYATQMVRSGDSPHGWQTSVNPAVVAMPRAEHFCVHTNKMFAGWVNEPNGTFPNRIRFSLEGTPTNWAENDYIDITGGGNGIRGMAVVNGSLLVFKPKATYIVYGYDRNNFQVVELSSTLGCDSHHAMVASDAGVYFYSLGRGLFFTDGNSIVDVFKNIRPIIDLGYVSSSSSEGVTVSWVGGRVWLSLPYSTTGSVPVYPTVNFVFDPTLGSYTMLQTADSRGVISGTDFRDNNNNEFRLMIHPTEPYVLNVDRYSAETDTITSEGQAFSSYYRTKWFDGGTYMQKKMFRRPDIVLKEADVDQTIQVTVWHNFDEGDTNYKRQFNITQSPANVALWDSAIWANDDSTNPTNPPNAGLWARETVSSTIKTGKNLGLAKTVQLQFDGPAGQSWGINSIGYKFNTRRVGG